MRARDCGVCHVEIAAEWSASIHARSWTDRQFQSELEKDAEVGWLCLNCHTPAADQQAEITVFNGSIRQPDRAPNPDFDPAWREEGISCASCHVREGVVLGPYGSSTAPHPVRLAPELLESSVCTTCHQAQARLEDALVCAFNTGVESSEAGAETCQSCHMPQVHRPLVEGGEVRAGRRHLWLGSLVPKAPLTPEEESYYALFEPGIDLSLAPATHSEEEGRVVRIVVENKRAGHMLPTGDPERFLLVHIEATDQEGRLIASLQHRIGQRWEWHPVARKLSDNRLAPGEVRVLTLPIEEQEGVLTVRVRAEHWRITPENAQYHALEDYPQMAVSLAKEFRLEPGP